MCIYTVQVQHDEHGQLITLQTVTYDAVQFFQLLSSY